MTKTVWPKGAPGSKEARGNGCSCPVLDNSYGLGRWSGGDQYGWYVNSTCPVHGVQEND